MKINYFGYGSLVNRDTVSEQADHTPGSLTGWVREWRVCGIARGTENTSLGRCSLTVRAEPGSEILGVLLSEPVAGLPALEAREKRYEKVHGMGERFQCVALGEPGPSEMFVFQARPEHRRWGCDTYPILQSYLDCVLAGYFRIWGAQGLRHFFETTDGWHVPVLRDRDAPVYRRAIKLEPDLRTLIDNELKGRGIRFV